MFWTLFVPTASPRVSVAFCILSITVSVTFLTCFFAFLVSCPTFLTTCFADSLMTSLSIFLVFESIFSSAASLSFFLDCSSKCIFFLISSSSDTLPESVEFSFNSTSEESVETGFSEFSDSSVFSTSSVFSSDFDVFCRFLCFFSFTGFASIASLSSASTIILASGGNIL